MRNQPIAPSSVCRAALAMALTFSAGASHADCTQADLKGLWYATSISTVPFGGVHDDFSFTTFCKIAVNSAGAFTKASSTCKSSAGISTIEGQMDVTPACLVKPFNLKVFDQTGAFLLFTQTVDYMAVTKGKDSFVATGNKNSATTNLVQFLWTGAKR